MARTARGRLERAALHGWRRSGSKVFQALSSLDKSKLKKRTLKLFNSFQVFSYLSNLCSHLSSRRQSLTFRPTLAMPIHSDASSLESNADCHLASRLGRFRVPKGFRQDNGLVIELWIIGRSLGVLPQSCGSPKASAKRKGHRQRESNSQHR